MKYAVVNESNHKGCIDGTITRFETEDEALKYAHDCYGSMAKEDKKKLCTFEVVAFENEEVFDDFGYYDEMIEDYLE